MKERITVFVNDQPLTIYRGLRVRHALIAYDQSVYAAAVDGEQVVEDERGFTIGLDGALHDGAKVYTKQRA